MGKPWLQKIIRTATIQQYLDFKLTYVTCKLDCAHTIGSSHGIQGQMQLHLGSAIVGLGITWWVRLRFIVCVLINL